MTTKVNMCNDGVLIDETAMKLMREEEEKKKKKKKK